MTLDSATVPARRGPRSAKRDALNIRLTTEDRRALQVIRKALRWIASDSDAVRYALAETSDALEARKARRPP